MRTVTIKVLTMKTSVLTLESLLANIEQYQKSGESAYICVSNVHMCMETFDNSPFKDIVNGADYVIPDGKPIAWAQKMLGAKNAEQIRGQDVTNALCKKSNDGQLSVGFYGGASDEILERVKTNLTKTYPKINIAYSFSPPFKALDELENQKIIASINDSGVDVLFVGIGCPKQEKWMAHHKSNFNCIMLGVGAAFDFIAGEKKHAPRWVQKIGLEWFFRLCCEPKRLWKRYLKHNPRFVYYFLQQWLLGRKFN